MELHDYPRPQDDTGIGIHWSVGYAASVGLNKIREVWLPALQALGVRWVKIYNHDGALDLAELLLAEEIMPIVRLHRPAPNPGRLGVKEVVYLDSLVRAGVRYFEFNNEPDQGAEWKGGLVPANGLEIVAENAIADMETILARGGMPAVPALSSGCRWDLVGKIVEKGRRDLFDGPVWQAIHNYPGNRPLDYPYDIGNQEGASYTRRFYQALQVEDWGQEAWRGRSLEEINRLRLAHCTPGASLDEDNRCFLAYEWADALNRRHLGRSLPILSTECGYRVGEDADPRYPATTPDLHMAQTLESARIMMGTSQRFQHAPDYYFCTAYMLLANAQLGSSSNWWEAFAWYSNNWAGGWVDGALPVVQALQAEPKLRRRWQDHAPEATVTLYGTVHHLDGPRHLVIERARGNEREAVARVLLEPQGDYRVPGLPTGEYQLFIEGTRLQQPLILSARTAANDGDATWQVGARPVREALLDLDLTGMLPSQAPRDAERHAPSASLLSGHVRGGGDGATVVLTRYSAFGDPDEWSTVAQADGAFRFVNLPAGEYGLAVYPSGSVVERVELDGREQMEEVGLIKAGWGHTIELEESTTADAETENGVVRCTVLDFSGDEAGAGVGGRTVYVRRGEWRSLPMQTSSEGRCDIRGLAAGVYTLVVEDGGSDDGRSDDGRSDDGRGDDGRGDDGRGGKNETGERLEAQVRLSGQTVPAVEFAHFPMNAAHAYLPGHPSPQSPAPVDADAAASEVEEGEQQKSPDATPTAPEPGAMSSSVLGTAPGAAGRIATLVKEDAAGDEQAEFQQIVMPGDHFRFDYLPTGRYTLRARGGFEQGDIALDGHSGVEVIFAPLLPTWTPEISTAGSMPGFSVVRVEVENKRDWPVQIWREDWAGVRALTGSKPEYGDFALEFGPLEPGHYMVEAEGLEAWIDFELTGLEALWINFRQQNVPSSDNIVRPLPSERAPEAGGESDEGFVDAAKHANPEQAVGQSTAQNGALPRHYLFLGQEIASDFVVNLTENNPGRDDTLEAFLHYLTTYRPAIGRDVQDAAQAQAIFTLGQHVEETMRRELAALDVPVQPFSWETLNRFTAGRE